MALAYQLELMLREQWYLVCARQKSHGFHAFDVVIYTLLWSRKGVVCFAFFFLVVVLD